MYLSKVVGYLSGSVAPHMMRITTSTKAVAAIIPKTKMMLT